jgi:uncharacterized membrane protein
MKKLSLYAMASIYIIAGIVHLVKPEALMFLMPLWMPAPITMIILSGIVEITLGIGLIPEKTRKLSAWGIITLLVVYFFVNHATMSVDFFYKESEWFLLSLLRLPLQFVLIWWAWTFTKENYKTQITKNTSL